jgi:hypothetical protein
MRERQEGRVHQSEEVAVEPEKKFICPTRKSWTKGRRYKSLVTSYSFEVDDSQEIQERRSPEGSSI